MYCTYIYLLSIGSLVNNAETVYCTCYYDPALLLQLGTGCPRMQINIGSTNFGTRVRIPVVDT